MIAIRGAVRVPRNDARSIHAETRALLEEIQRRNGLDPSRIVSAFFTMTPDLDADFPAHAARQLGWDRVPMLGALERAVPGAPDGLVGVLLLADWEGPARHVYMGEAAALRPDLSGLAAPRAAPRGGGDSRTAADPGPADPGASAEGGRESVLIVGLGLIGGSLARDLSTSRRFGPVSGVDRDRAAVEAAVAAGAVEAAGAEPDPTQADTVLLCAPVGAIIEWLREVGPTLGRGQVVIDVGSTKRGIVRAMSELPVGVEAIGAHPMAGSELAGAAAARPGLLRGAIWALVETERTGDRARAVVSALVEETGGKGLFVDAERHDRVVARTSHLPWLLSAALARTLAADQEVLATPLAGPGLRDTTRLAGSDPGLIGEILMSNWSNIREAAARYEAELARLVAELDTVAAASAEHEAAGPETGGKEMGRLTAVLAAIREQAATVSALAKV